MVTYKNHGELLPDSLIAYLLVSWYNNLIWGLFICGKGQCNFLIAHLASPRMSCPLYLTMMLVPYWIKLMC